MKKKRAYVLCASFLCAVAVAIAGCGGNNPPQPGFNVVGEKYVEVFGGGFMFVTFTTIRGNWVSDNGSAVGTTTSFGPQLCNGPCPVSQGRVPATWNIVAGIPGAECVFYREPTQRNVTSGSTQKSRCVTGGIIFPFSVSPNSINLQAPPATVDMTGQGLNTTYGMPSVEYVDQYTGQVLGSATATAVNGGTWLRAPVPDLSSVYSGTYNILISNATSGGGREYVGTATVSCYGRDGWYEPPPDPDPNPDPDQCGCPPNMPCMPCNY